MNLNLKGKNAIVCGSTQGIGKATAIEIASLGANVTLIARDEQKLKQVINELNKSSEQTHNYICADFSDPGSLKEKLHVFLSKNSPIQILVNNTGGPPGGKVSDATLDEFEKAFTNHLKCNHVLVQAILPGMKEAGYGRIINIISTSVIQPISGLGVSNTIRGAVANWSKTLAGELASYGITVNNVLPGMTETLRLKSLIEKKADQAGKAIEKMEEEMIAKIPAGRFAKAEEIANVIAFLATPAAAYINGVNIPVDGGRIACQ